VTLGVCTPAVAAASDTTLTRQLYEIWVDHAAVVYGLIVAQVLITGLLALLLVRNRQLKIARAEAAAAPQRLTDALEAAGHGVWTWQIADNQMLLSRPWKQMLGFAEAEIGAQLEDWLSLIHPDDLERTRQALERHLAGQTPVYRCIFRMRAKDAQWRWILARGKALDPGDGGPPRSMIGTHTDVTREREAEAALSHQQELFAMAINQASDSFAIIDTETLGFVLFNEAACKSLGYTEGEMSQLTLPQIQAELTEGDVRQRMAQLIQDGGGSFETRHRCKDGTERLVVVRNQLIREDRQLLMAATWIDITEERQHERALRESQASLEQLAYYDPMTGLPNRSLLLDRLKQAVAVADHGKSSLAVCYIDLDDFKPINDHYGKDIGDRLLKTVARRLEQRINGGDTLGRWGGDEFAVLLAGIGSIGDCEERLTGLLDEIARPIVLDQHQFTLSASIGVAFYPEDRADADTLLRHADHAMYLAKQRGRHDYQFFDATKDALAIAHRDQLREFSQALEHGELRLFYQPIVDMRRGQVQGLEALIRWQHPERGLLAPGDFLPAIEGSDLIRRLDRWVLAQSLADLARWSTRSQPLNLHINMSAASLNALDFLDEVCASVAQYPRLALAQLGIEVLETSALEDLDAVGAILREGGRRGLRFALDDFGTGYSSLTYFRQLPAAVLKIDQSFVRNMLRHKDDLRIVEAVIGLAHAFDREIIAEGVETEAHGTLLLRMGCRLAQGYGIARPMSRDRVLPWLRSYRQPQAWRSVSRHVWLQEDMPLITMEVEHRGWVEAVVALARGADDVEPLVPNASDCHFGRWYVQDGRRRYGERPGFRRLQQLHERVHDLASGVVHQHARGEPAAADELAQLQQASEALIEQVSELQMEVALGDNDDRLSPAQPPSTTAQH
jgi:diguanylate cyclase (GGDEF)-like protein/PAS domain S-box-containing protein